MAEIRSATTKSFHIDKWLGLNEAQDGDGRLKYGEASQCRNWRVTKDGTLRRRPGSRTLFSLPGAVRCLWSGQVGTESVFLAATSSSLYRLEPGGEEPSLIGTFQTAPAVSIFGFGGLAYVLTGAEYKVFDGEDLQDVDGYVPLVRVAVPPTGGGAALERINRLTPKRRAWFSPDGEATVFQLPETGLSSIDYVKDLATGDEITGCNVDTAAGQVTFASPPAAGASSIEIGWTHPISFRGQITGMRYAEFYNGTNDNRVFLYGNGTNKIYYSDIDYDGQPRADYFPDLNEIAVGTENTPVTGLIKHYSRLVVCKPSETYTVAYGTTTLADGSVTAAFYLTPVNRSLGNEAPGQVQLVLNAPRTLCGRALYEWRNNSSYSANLTLDERQAKRLSDRIYRTLESFALPSCICWDDNQTQEYYIVYGRTALVHNYAADVWYKYYNFPATAFCRHDGELYIGDDAGGVRHISDAYGDDDGRTISAYWETGSIHFGTATRRKYFCECWVTCSPLESGKVSVAAVTDRARAETEIEMPRRGATFDFSALDFGRLSFDFSRLAEAHHLRLRMRRFTFCKLRFIADGTNAAASISALDMNVIYGGESR